MPAELIILGNPKRASRRREQIGRAMAKARARAAKLTRIGRRKLNPAEMAILGGNPAGRVSEKAAGLYEDFHGAQPKELLAVNELQDMPHEAVSLGDLESLTVNAPKGEMKISFEGDGVKVASDASGSQLYFVGGNQNLNAALSQFRSAADSATRAVRLGRAEKIIYSARKKMDGFNLSNYIHQFGEEDGKKPVAWYDANLKRIYLVGGNYRIEAPGIIN
jgi:hypothetical protein